MSITSRNLLHKSQLELFKKWMEKSGFTPLPTKTEWEVARFKTDEQPIIIYRRLKGDHLTAHQPEAQHLISLFIKEKKRRHFQEEPP